MGDLNPTVVTFNLYTVGTGNPADGPFLITFAFDLDAANVVVEIKEPEDSSFETKVKDVDWTLDVGASAVRFITTTYNPPDGTTVRISRFTDRLRVLDYRPGGTITAGNLNDDNNQEFFILQEIENDLERALFKDLTSSFWQGEGLRSHNCSEATTESGWTTLSQVEAIVEGGEIVHINDAKVYTFVGDGETVFFELTELRDISAQRVILSINGVIQQTGEEGTQWEDLIYATLGEDDTGYPGTAFTWDVIEMVNAPANGDIIEARIITGTVIAQFREGVVDADAIADCAILERHICFNKSPASRIIFNPSTDPTYEDISSIANFEAAMDVWLAAKGYSDFTDLIDQNVDMNGNKIRVLANATLPDDAMAYGQRLGWLVKHTNVSEISESQDRVIEIGFDADIAIFFGRRTPAIASTNYRCFWMFNFKREDNIKSMVGGAVGNAEDGANVISMPTLTAKRQGSGNNATIRVSIQQGWPSPPPEDNVTVNKLTVLAIKF